MKIKPKERNRRGGAPPSRFRVPPYAGLLALGLPPAAFGSSFVAAIDAAAWSGSLLLPAIGAILLVVLLNGLYTAGETSLQLLRSSHLKAFEKDDPSHRRLTDLFEHRGKYASVCTLGRQTMQAWMMVLSFLPAPAVADWLRGVTRWPEGVGGWLLAGLALTIPVATLNLIVGDLVPKSLAILHPRRTLLRLYGLLRASSALFAPLGRLMTGAASLITNRFGTEATFAVTPAEEEIKTIVESAEEAGEIEREERRLLHSVFEFTDTVAREVMTPRVDMDAVEVGADPSHVIGLIQSSGRSRIPVYEENDDQIIGIVHAKDLLMAQLDSPGQVSLRSLMRPALFVPENKNLHDLLRELKAGRSQMAIVQDEFGGTAGIVTIEDIVEELVGDIVDEYDIEEPDFIENGTGYLVGGKLNLYDLNEEIGSRFESEEFDTVGGYVFGLFGRQPKVGEAIESEGYLFRVEEIDGRRIRRLHVERIPEPSEDTASIS